MTVIRPYDPSLAEKITASGRHSLNEMILRMAPEGCETWHGIIAAQADEGDVHAAATAWLTAKRAEFNQSHTGVYWIKDDVVAVEFKLLFT